MSDLIKRQDAIYAVYHHFPTVTMEGGYMVLHEVPSAEPEIIKCDECKYSEESDEREWLLCHFYGDQWNEPNHWCSHAERGINE